MTRWKALLPVLCILALVLAAVLPLAVRAAPPVQPADLNPRGDWARVQDAGKIVVGTAADYEPFEFYNSDFALDGFDIALMRELGRRMGLEVEFKDFAFDGLLDALQLGQVDAAISAISVTPERQTVADFTNLYYVGDDVALATAAFTGTIESAADLAGLRVGVERGTTYQAWVQQNVVDAGLSDQDALRAYSDTNQVIRDLRNGTTDVALMGALPAREFMRRFPDLKLGGQSYNTQEFAIAARQDSSLVDQLNKALLATQSDGTFAELVNLYLQVPPDGVTPTGPDAEVDNDAAPAPVPTATAPAQPAATPTPGPTPTPAPPACIDGMAFIADLNYDDQNMTAPPILAPGQAFTKSWRVQNTGTCAWTPDYAVVYVNGNRPEARMNGSTVAVNRTVAPGELLDISVNLLAPQSYGTFQGFWQMRNAAGEYFGQVMWVGIQVPDPNPPAPPAPPAPPPPGPPAPPAPGGPNLRADAGYISAGQCTTIRWDVDGVQAVYFFDGGNQIGVGGHDARTVCPSQTTTYTLRVIQTNGAGSDYSIVINVSGGGGGGYYIDFWADRKEINRGECTTLHWEVEGVQAVYLNDKGEVGVGSKQVCPNDSKTYRLTAVKMDGGTETREIRIRVY